MEKRATRRRAVEALGEAPAGFEAGGPLETPDVSAGDDGDEPPHGGPVDARGVLSAFAHLRSRLAAVPSIPLFFLGLGVYRAWIEIAFVGSFVDFPTHAFAGHNAFDAFMVVTMLLCARFACRLAPLYRCRAVRYGAPALLVASTAIEFSSVWFPQTAAWAAWAAVLFGGVGIAFVILLWSELYGCLSPVRICLYYASSLVAGAVIIWVYRGFVIEWLPAMTCLLPVVSLLCLRSCYRSMPSESLPRHDWARFSFPWKPVLLVAVYSFAFGLQETGAYQVTGPHSSPGMVACALVVVAGIVLLGDRIEFSTIYSLWLPFMSAVFLALPALGGMSPWLCNFCANWGYAASEIFVMTMIGSIAYRYGVSAVWLFGIERGVRALAMLAGRLLEQHVLGIAVPTGTVVVTAVLVATFLVLSEKKLNAKWGVQMREDGPDAASHNEAARRNALGVRCAELGRAYRLSQREEEVLLLLAQRKTAGDIERELYIANGTAKAHIRHIYQKLDIHSREELFALVDGGASHTPPEAPAQGAA